jgi:hypothetical protein
MRDSGNSTPFQQKLDLIFSQSANLSDDRAGILNYQRNVISDPVVTCDERDQNCEPSRISKNAELWWRTDPKARKADLATRTRLEIRPYSRPFRPQTAINVSKGSRDFREFRKG